MKSFIDQSGRAWKITMNIGVAKKIKEELGVDILAPEVGDPPPVERMALDALFLADIVSVILDEQARHYEVEVHEALDGDTFKKAADAFFAELVDFFRQSGRPDRAKVIVAQQKMMESAIKMAEIQVEKIAVEEIVKTKEKTSGSRSGKSRGTSGSTRSR